MSDGPELIPIDPNWPQWRKDEVEGANAIRIQQWDARKRQKERPPQSSGPQGPSDLEKRRMRREAEARRQADAEAEAARARNSGSRRQDDAKARNRARDIDAAIDEALTGRQREGQSTDNSQ